MEASQNRAQRKIEEATDLFGRKPLHIVEYERSAVGQLGRPGERFVYRAAGLNRRTAGRGRLLSNRDTACKQRGCKNAERRKPRGERVHDALQNE